jgi:hypothetical protein
MEGMSESLWILDLAMNEYTIALGTSNLWAVDALAYSRRKQPAVLILPFFPVDRVLRRID